MKYVINSEQAKAVDTYTINEIGIPSLVLMERAAVSVVQEIEKKITDTDKVLCVCGVGNNGGDGIAVARILHQKGYTVCCQMVGNLEKSSTDNIKQRQIAEKMGVSFVNNRNLQEYTIIVDAIFGIGLSREVSGVFAEWIKQINQLHAYVYAIDLPSGIHTDTGQIMGCAVRADTTVTFGYRKLGSVYYPGAEHAGMVVVTDIGFAKEYEKYFTHYTYEKEDIKKYMPKRAAYSNKGTFGKVLVIAGSNNMAGACYLSAYAAYEMGAGLVKVITPKENRTIIQQLLPEAVLHTYDIEHIERQKNELIQDIKDARAIVVGPGMGINVASENLLDWVFHETDVPTVIDADAIQILAGRQKEIPKFDGKKLKWMLRENMIITPHLKEMADLLGDKKHLLSMQNQQLDIREIASENENILVLKDARTLVVQKEKCYINLSGNSGMATAGAGDVLTGIVLGLLAQKVEPYMAATLGVYIHGIAGEEAAKKKGTYSVTARDLIAMLPRVLMQQEEM